jgi:hypothetical protein
MRPFQSSFSVPVLMPLYSLELEPAQQEALGGFEDDGLGLHGLSGTGGNGFDECHFEETLTNVKRN